MFVGLYVSSIKTGTRRIIRLDQLSSVVRLERRTKEGSSSTRIMRLVSVFILVTHNPTNNECLPEFFQTDNASSSVKTAIQSYTELYDQSKAETDTGPTLELLTGPLALKVAYAGQAFFLSIKK